jgi:hypothetical protein
MTCDIYNMLRVYLKHVRWECVTTYGFAASLALLRLGWVLYYVVGGRLGTRLKRARRGLLPGIAMVSDSVGYVGSSHLCGAGVVISHLQVPLWPSLRYPSDSAGGMRR